MTAVEPKADLSSPAAPQPRPVAARRSIRPSELLHRYALALAWLAVVAVFSVWDPDRYFTLATFQSIFNSQSALLLVAVAQLIPLVAGDFDFSPAATAGLVNVLLADMVLEHGWSLGSAVLLVVAVAVLISLVNAVLVVWVGVESLIVTLGMFTLLGGVTIGVNASPTGGYSGGLDEFVTHKVFGLQMAFWVAVVIYLVLWFWLKHLPSGRRLHFVGFNREVARLSGIRSSALRFVAFVLAGLLSALAGVLLFGLLGGSSPTVGTSMVFPAITAVILGSTAITPGIYNVGGTFIAVYLLMFGITGLELQGHSGWVPQVFFGGALIVAVVMSNITGRTLIRRS